MQFLTDSQSWYLLKQKVFKNSYWPPELVKIGKEIARKCLGLPLVVVLVAGLLSTAKQTPVSWEEISKTVNPVVGQESDEILSSSYTHLPHHLRPCFLFLGCYPEDAEIQASRLVKLWVAEGYMKHEEGSSKSMEEEAEEYLEDLVNRNLVMVNSRKREGKVKSCSLHDMVRDLCIRIGKEEKFLHVMTYNDLPQGMINERLISFNRPDINKIWGPTIRTIICLKFQMFPSWLAYLGCFRLLRVLDGVGHNPKELPAQLFELFHLRYLALSCSITIPSAISNLVNLQTLVINSPAFRTRKIYWRYYKDASQLFFPLEIWRMPQLRHVVLNDLYMLPHPPDGSNLALENLQTLLHIQDLVWNGKLVQMIPNVKKLGLVYTTNQDYHLHHLKDLHQLEKLKVNGYRKFSWQRNVPSFPRTLKKLTLEGGGYAWDDLGTYGSLPNLQVLKLLSKSCDGETWKTGDGQFPQLKFLIIVGSDLHQWITQSSHFPRLKHLALGSCKRLEKIPKCIGEIPTLELIELSNCGEDLVKSAMQIKDDQQSYGNEALQVRTSL